MAQLIADRRDIDFLIPVLKAYCSERGLFICDQAIQIYGGLQ